MTYNKDDLITSTDSARPMAGQLLPPSELAPHDLGDVPVERRVAVWLDMLNAGYKLVLAGLSREVGPEGDLQGAYRNWNDEQMEEHDRKLVRMMYRMQHPG